GLATRNIPYRACRISAHSQRSTVRAEGQEARAPSRRLEGTHLLMAKPVQVIPFPAAQVRLPFPRRPAAFAFQQLEQPVDVLVVPLPMGQVRVRCVERVAEAIVLLLRP